MTDTESFINENIGTYSSSLGFVVMDSDDENERQRCREPAKLELAELGVFPLRTIVHLHSHKL